MLFLSIHTSPDFNLHPPFLFPKAIHCPVLGLARVLVMPDMRVRQVIFFRVGLGVWGVRFLGLFVRVFCLGLVGCLFGGRFFRLGSYS